jgi:hypothetical protein
MYEMADFGRGIKAGAAVAAVYLIIAVILELTGLSYQVSVITAAGLGIHLELTYFPFVIYSILAYIVRGIIFGAVFAALYDFLPGTTTVKKGVVLSAFLWILSAVGLIYTTPGWPTSGGHTSMAGITVSLSSVGLALAGIISALAFGALTGFLWGRFRGKELAEERKGRPVLLVSFSLGIWMWASSLIGIIISVVNGWNLVIEPGPFWWYSILAVSVVFLGLPGWIIALIAWRKTRGGESGFKWGMAGGVIMALTGVMLLPGVLAIIGGVFSGRKPAAEPITAAIEQ